MDPSLTRRHDRPAGLSPLRGGDITPPYASGVRNDYYVNPTFRSSVFTAHQERRADQQRARSTHRDNYGTEIYRSTVYADRQGDHTDRGRSRNFNRQADPVSAQQYQTYSHYEANQDRAPRRSHTPTRTPQNEAAHQLASHRSQAQIDRPRTPTRTPHNEVITTQAVQGSQAYIPAHEDQYMTYHHRDGFGHNYTTVDRAVPTTRIGQVINRDHNQIVDHRATHRQHEANIESVEKDLHRTYYEDPTHNAHIRRDSLERGNFYDGYQSTRRGVPADNLYDATLNQREDLRGNIYDLESQQKRDYQRKIDEYHRTIAELNYQNRSKSQMKRLEAEVSRQKAALIEEEKRLEQLKEKDNKRMYKEMLDHQQHVQYRTYQGEKDITLATERQPAHTEVKRRRERPMMERLGNNLQEAMQFRKRLDNMTKAGRADELLRNPTYYDQVQKELQDRTEMRRNYDYTGNQDEKRAVVDYLNAKTDRNLQERTVDGLLVRNLQEHDENNLIHEAQRKRAMQRELRDTLVEQMRDKEDRALTQNLTHRKLEIRFNDGDGFGSNTNAGLINVDQKPEVDYRHSRRNASVSKEKQTDKQLVQALSDFDAKKIQEEKDRKREMAHQLNYILKEQMKLNEGQ